MRERANSTRRRCFRSVLIGVIKSDRIDDGVLPGTFYSWYTRQGHVCKVQAIITLVFRCKLAGNGASLKIYLRRAKCRRDSLSLSPPPRLCFANERVNEGTLTSIEGANDGEYKAYVITRRMKNSETVRYNVGEPMMPSGFMSILMTSCTISEKLC